MHSSRPLTPWTVEGATILSTMEFLTANAENPSSDDEDSAEKIDMIVDKRANIEAKYAKTESNNTSINIDIPYSKNKYIKNV